MTTPDSSQSSPVTLPEKSAIIDKGFTSDVHAWGDGKVLKLFHRWVPVDRAEREYRVTRAVHAAGLPAPAAHELIEKMFSEPVAPVLPEAFPPVAYRYTGGDSKMGGPAWGNGKSVAASLVEMIRPPLATCVLWLRSNRTRNENQNTIV
jgi:hypothetical protein